VRANHSAKRAARAVAQATGTTYASARNSERTTWARAIDEHTELVRFWESPRGLVLGGQILAVGRRTAAFQEIWRNHSAAGATAEADDALGQPDIAATPEEWEDKINEFSLQLKAFADRVLGPFDRDAASAEVVAEQAAAVKTADTFAVTTDMVSLVEHAATTMPVETVERADPPCLNGFVYLESPFRLIDDAGRGHPQRALHWVVSADEIRVVCYRRRDDYADGEAPLSPAEEGVLPRLLVGIEWVWRFGDPSFGGQAMGTNPDVPQVARFLKALWAISAQRLATTEMARPDRQTARRAQRAGVVTAGVVKVVQLRRLEAAAADGVEDARSVEWSHRWIVNGHWRNQYLPSSGLHRQQWIDPHVKGPEDLPLVVKPTVFHVVR
jgi:hypothetical protein